MTLEQLGTLFQLIWTLGVIASLILCRVQIRQNTKATRVQVQENMTEGYLSVAQILIDNAEVFTQGLTAARSAAARMQFVIRLGGKIPYNFR